MINFFGKQNKDEGDPTESRLRTIEWKLNALLVIIAGQLLLTLLMFTKDLIVPSTSSIVIGCILLFVGVWLFRRPLFALMKRLLARHLFGEDSVMKSSTASDAEKPIR